MKIIQIIPFFGVGGAEIMCENLSYELKKLGNEVIVISLYNRETIITKRLKSNGIDIRFLGKKRGIDFKVIKSLTNLFFAEKPDVVHTHLYIDKYVMPAAIKVGIKNIVHTVHTIAEKEIDFISKKLNKHYFYKYNVIPVALSERIQKSIMKTYKMNQNQIPIVYNGVNFEKCLLKNDYKIKDKFTILHIGRFVTAKNHMGLVDAFYLFQKKYKDTELWLIGEGETKKNVEKLVSEYGLEKNVKFLGIQSNVYNYLNKADVFILPSLYEGIPMTLIEAMGTGLPVIATPVGGIPDMLIDNESGLFVSNDSNSICQSLEKLYNDENLRSFIGFNAKKRSEMFSSIEMAKKYLNIYKR